MGAVKIDASVLGAGPGGLLGAGGVLGPAGPVLPGGVRTLYELAWDFKVYEDQGLLGNIVFVPIAIEASAFLLFRDANNKLILSVKCDGIRGGGGDGNTKNRITGTKLVSAADWNAITNVQVIVTPQAGWKDGVGYYGFTLSTQVIVATTCEIATVNLSNFYVQKKPK